MSASVRRHGAPDVRPALSWRRLDASSGLGQVCAWLNRDAARWVGKDLMAVGHSIRYSDECLLQLSLPARRSSSLRRLRNEKLPALPPRMTRRWCKASMQETMKLSRKSCSVIATGFSPWRLACCAIVPTRRKSLRTPSSARIVAWPSFAATHRWRHGCITSLSILRATDTGIFDGATGRIRFHSILPYRRIAHGHSPT